MQMVSFPVLDHGVRRVVQSGNSSDLVSILDIDVNLAIWERNLEPPVRGYIQELIHSHKFSTFRAEAEVLDPEFRFSILPEFVGKEEFIKDLRFLYSKMVQISGNLSPSLHLCKIYRTQCPLFHVDFNHLRLLSTLSGPGTVWIPNESVDRSHLGCGRNDHIWVGERIQREIKSESVAILKGEKFPGNQGFGIVHKSPEISGNTPRLFLRIES
jgi:hypothetical protein